MINNHHFFPPFLRCRSWLAAAHEPQRHLFEASQDILTQRLRRAANRDVAATRQHWRWGMLHGCLQYPPLQDTPPLSAAQRPENLFKA